MAGATLVIDVGNSRVKWALHGPRGFLTFGAISNSEVGTLALRDWQALPKPVRIVGVNVAGEAMRMRIETQLTRWRMTPQWLTATASACGVANSYVTPSQLGADRWAALVGARRRAVSEVESPPPAIVVNAGTSVTVDALDRNGLFRGGVILPGMRLMLHALAEKTAALNVPPGLYQDFPTNTADALYSGVIVAVAGAIKQMRSRIQADGSVATCFLSGGAADEIAPYLNAPLTVVDNLVLEGVLALADEM